MMIGKVLLSLGETFNIDRHIIDWEIVEMPSSPENRNFWSSQVKNQLPYEAAAGIYKHLAMDYKSSISSYTPGNPEKTFQEFSKLRMGQWYFKVGQTTAITAGFCHGTKVILRTSGTEELTIARTQYEKTGKSHRLSEPVEFVEEYIILNVKSGQGVHE